MKSGRKQKSSGSSFWNALGRGDKTQSDSGSNDRDLSAADTYRPSRDSWGKIYGNRKHRSQYPFGDADRKNATRDTPGEKEAGRPASSRRPRRAPLLIAAVLACIALLVWGTGSGRSKSSAAPGPGSGTPDPVMAAVSPTPEPTALPTQEPSSVRVPSPSTKFEFIREQLSSDEKQTYDMLRDALFSRAARLDDVRCASADRLWEILHCVLNDHPEIYWFEWDVTGYEPEPGNFSLDLRYYYTESELAEVQRKMDETAAPVISDLLGKTEYEKVKGVFDYLVLNTDYVASDRDQTIVSVLLDHTGVCTGYARTTQYLLHLLDVESILVSGTATNDVFGTDGHSWNLVKIDGEWYQIDTTWGDPVEKDGSPGNSLEYTYFCITSEEMLQDHNPDISFSIPWCTAVSANYYLREGRWFETYDRQAIFDLLRSDWAAGRECRFRLGNENAYRATLRGLLDDGELYQAIPELGPSSYMQNDRFRTLSIYF